nr:hypothetical protein [Acetivibrio cellulolyticus]
MKFSILCKQTPPQDTILINVMVSMAAQDLICQNIGLPVVLACTTRMLKKYTNL